MVCVRLSLTFLVRGVLTGSTAEDQFARLVDADGIDIDDGLAAARAKHRSGGMMDFGGSIAGESDDSQDIGARRAQGSVAPSVDASVEGEERGAVRRACLSEQENVSPITAQKRRKKEANPLKVLYKAVRHLSPCLTTPALRLTDHSRN